MSNSFMQYSTFKLFLYRYFFVAERGRASDVADLLLPAQTAALLEQGDDGRASALRNPELPLDRHGQLHVDAQRRGR